MARTQYDRGPESSGKLPQRQTHSAQVQAGSGMRLQGKEGAVLPVASKAWERVSSDSEPSAGAGLATPGLTLPASVLWECDLRGLGRSPCSAGQPGQADSVPQAGASGPEGTAGHHQRAGGEEPSLLCREKLGAALPDSGGSGAIP